MPRGLRRLRLSLMVLGALAAVAPAVAVAAKDTVTISGRAYAFNHMDTYLAGASIRVREYPKLSATTDVNGDYALEVPDDANVTPYIDPPDGYNQIDLQTFHPRGEDIENANFQTPADLEYNALAAILSVPLGPDGRPEQCAIVTTASARNVRGVDYETFRERTPHGVAGSTAKAIPSLPGPTYFNEFVIPDPNETATSEDGGIVWSVVPAGTYRIVVRGPATQFASFLATCENGRVVNANPPWGAYELTGNEKPLAAGVVASSVTKAKAKGGKIVATVESAEAVSLVASLSKEGRTVGPKRSVDLRAGSKKVKVPFDQSAGKGKATLKVKLRDAAGDVVKSNLGVKLP